MTTQIAMLGAPVSPGTLDPYPFQAAAIGSLRGGMRKGHQRQVLCAPTGAGKTEIAAFLIQEAAHKHSRVAFVCDRRVLVRQTSERLARYGILHGVAMADDTFGRHEPIQVCSAHTIEKRNYWSDLDLMIIDECHAQRKKILEFAKSWGGPVIGLSATPMTPGLGQWYSHVVNAVTTNYLTETVNPRTGQTYLAPLRIYPATAMDMTGAEVQAGEWTKKSVQESSSRIVGDIVGDWERLTTEIFGGPVKTLLFTASIADGRDLCRAFQEAGYDFRQTTHRDSTAETETLIQGFRDGRFVGLASVSKLTKGFDVPDVLCGIDARPNRSSLAEVIQKMGRVMRSSEDKPFGLWLDHAENVLRWYDEIGEFWAQGVNELDDGKKSEPKPAQVHRQDAVCMGCGFVLPPGARECPACGKPRPKRRSQTQVVPGRIDGELNFDQPTKAGWAKDLYWVWQQVSAIALERKAGDMEAARKAAAGYWKGIYGQWPTWGKQLDPCDFRDIDDRVAGKVTSNLIKYAKAKGKGK